MGRNAPCDDHAVTESVVHTLNVERVHRERDVTRRLAQSSIVEYSETYDNRQRTHAARGHWIPMLLEKAAYPVSDFVGEDQLAVFIIKIDILLTITS